MSTLSDTWSGLLDAGDPADGSVVDGALDNIRTILNGGIDSTNLSASPAIPVTGLDTGAVLHNVGAASKRRVQYGRKSTSIVTGAGAEVTVTFSTDASEGGAAFSSGNPVLLGCTVESTNATTQYYVVTVTQQPTTTTFKYKVLDVNAGGATETVYVHWCVIGVTT